MPHTPLDCFRSSIWTDYCRSHVLPQVSPPYQPRPGQRLGIYIEAPSLRPIPARSFDCLAMPELKRQTTSMTLARMLTSERA